MTHVNLNGVPHISMPEQQLLAVLCRSSLRRVLVKSNANSWSARMQLTGQWQVDAYDHTRWEYQSIFVVNLERGLSELQLARGQIYYLGVALLCL